MIGVSSGDAHTINAVSDRRSNSYSRLLRSARLRLQMQLFLSRVFNVTSASAMYSQILAAVYHKDNALDDLAIYKHLMANAKPEGPLAALTSQWKKVVQLREQKVEFRDEVARIMGRLGIIGLVKDYVAVGDNGKMVLELNTTCGVDGNVWTVDPPESAEITIEAAVNRCAPSPASSPCCAFYYYFFLIARCKIHVAESLLCPLRSPPSALMLGYFAEEASPASGSTWTSPT
jgi:hypothetical protein